MNERYEKIFKPLQNGSDVRGSAIATEKEPKNLTPEIAADIAAGFLTWLEMRTGKPASGQPSHRGYPEERRPVRAFRSLRLRLRSRVHTLPLHLNDPS